MVICFLKRFFFKTGISNDMFGITDLLKETWNRITGYRNYRTRLIPFWSLMLPTSFYFVGLHVASSCFERIFKRFFASLNKMFDDRVRVNRFLKSLLILKIKIILNKREE
jgi:hypothetical protein